MAVYTGYANATMDDKNRLTIHKKFRSLMPQEETGETIIWLVPGYQKSEFIIMDNETGTRWARALISPAIGAGKKAAGKILLARSEKVEVDKSGRVLLTKNFLASSGVNKHEFTLTGNGDHISVYGVADWEELQTSITQADIDELWDDVNNLVVDEGN